MQKDTTLKPHHRLHGAAQGEHKLHKLPAGFIVCRLSFYKDDDEWDKEKDIRLVLEVSGEDIPLPISSSSSPPFPSSSIFLLLSHPSFLSKKKSNYKSSTRKWKGMRLKIVGFARSMITISDETSYWPCCCFVDATTKISKPFGQCHWAVLRESRQWVLIKLEVNRDAKDKQSPLSPR